MTCALCGGTGLVFDPPVPSVCMACSAPPDTLRTPTPDMAHRDTEPAPPLEYDPDAWSEVP